MYKPCNKAAKMAIHYKPVFCIPLWCRYGFFFLNFLNNNKMTPIVTIPLALMLSHWIADFICGKQHKDDSAILMDTRFTTEETAKKREAEMSQPSDYGDCNDCKANKEKGIILIGFDESKSDFTLKPQGAGFYRTGQYLVVTEEGYKKFPFPKEHIDAGLKHRCMFIPEQIALQIIKDANG